MANNSETRVYILGAGCSYHEQQGYPLAKQFVTELKSYTEKIKGVTECERIRKAVEDTVKLLTYCQSGQTHHASTIDQLITLILIGQCDDQLAALNPDSPTDIVGLQYEAVRKAKIATAACFLDKEGTARQHRIENYKEFIQGKVLRETGISTPCLDRLQKSNARVLSFNYDRLFELAFFAAFADRRVKRYDSHSDVVLNSGLNALGEVTEVEKDRFCLLKLHGSIGMISTENEFGQNVYRIDDLANWKVQNVTDALFFPANPAANLLQAPLIVFPYEKDFIVSGKNNKLPFRSYIDTVWKHAKFVLQEASEIWIIGYSFDPTDRLRLIEYLRQAKNCKHIYIQNLPAECDRISKLLRNEYGFQIPIDRHDQPF